MLRSPGKHRRGCEIGLGGYFLDRANLGPRISVGQTGNRFGERPAFPAVNTGLNEFSDRSGGLENVIKVVVSVVDASKRDCPLPAHSVCGGIGDRKWGAHARQAGLAAYCFFAFATHMHMKSHGCRFPQKARPRLHIGIACAA